MSKKKRNLREVSSQVRLAAEHKDGVDRQSPQEAFKAPVGEVAVPAGAETRVQELNRLLLAIREVNKLIVREREPQQLLAETCALLVKTRGYALAWIGLTQPGCKRVVPAARAGSQAGYLDDVSVAWDESPTGQGPVGAAIRTGRHWLCQDTAADPRFAPWKQPALARGLASLAAVPLIQGSRVLGALTVYADRREAFPEEEVALLNEVAEDLAFALQSIEHERERLQAEARARLASSALEAAANAVAITDRQGVIIWVNLAFSQLTGYSFEELCGRKPSILKSGAHDGAFYRQLWDTILAGRVWRSEMVNRRKDGSLYTEENTITPVRNEGAEITHFVAVKQDVTERQRAEAALAKSEEQFRAMFEVASIGMAQADPRTGQWLRVNKKMCAISGYSAAELFRMRVPELTHPDDRQKDWAQFERVVRGEAADYRLEKRYVCKDGTVAWVNVNMTVLRDAVGQPVRTMAAIEDITERKQAEATLRRREAYFQALIEGASDVTTLLGADGTMRYLSPSLEQVLSYKPDELVGRRAFELIHPDDLARVQQALAELTATPGATTRIEFRFRHKDGSWHLLEATARYLLDDLNVKGVVVNSRDNTERQRLEEALRESSQFNQQIIASAQEGIIVYDRDLRYRVWNPCMERLTGLSAAQVLGKPAVEVFPFLAESRIAAARASALAGGEPTTIEFEYRVPQTDRCGWAVDRSAPLRDSQGNVIGIIALVRDITERKQAEQDLLASEVRYRRLFEAAKDGVLILDAGTGMVLDVNPFLVQLLGLSKEALLGKEIWELGFFKDIVASQDHFKELQEAEYIRYDDKPLKTADGRRIDVEFVGNVYQVNRQKVIQCNIRDITERRLTEWRAMIYKDQLRALSARIEALREEERTRISREIHDELGQMLTGIKMDLRWMEHRLDEFGDDRRVNPILDKLVATAELIDATAKTVQRIAAELRPGLLDKLGLPTALQYEATRFEERTGIACRLIVPGGALTLRPEVATAFFRIFQEALTNVARHAKATAVEAELQPEADGCRLEIRDNGQGMAGVDLANLKSLGLLGMHERASLLGGGVSFAPRPGGGTVVTARIPNRPTAKGGA
jgi:PAS domain S-box-containing protein